MKKITAILLILTLYLCSACYPTGEISSPDDVTQYIPTCENNSDKSQISPEDTNELKESFNNVTVNCSLPKDPENTFEFNTMPMTWDNENLKDIFLSDKGDISEQSYESDFAPGELRYVYDTTKKYRLIAESGYITYSDLNNPNRDEYTILQSSWSIDDMKSIFGSEELKNFSKYQAIESAKQIIEKCCIYDYGSPMIYSLNAKKVNKYFSENFDGMEKKDGSTYQVNWSNDEEAYLLVFPQVIKNISVSYDSSYIDVIITKTGITEFSVVNWLDATIDDKKSVDLKYSSIEAMNILIDYYNSIIQSSPIEVINCQLSLYPITAVGKTPIQYIPVWDFDIKSKQDNGQYLLQKMNISASTGRQVVRQDQ